MRRWRSRPRIDVAQIVESALAMCRQALPGLGGSLFLSIGAPSLLERVRGAMLLFSLLGGGEEERRSSVHCLYHL